MYMYSIVYALIVTTAFKLARAFSTLRVLFFIPDSDCPWDMHSKLPSLEDPPVVE